MSTPDPQTARDFARRAILSSAEDVDFMGIAEQFSDDENWPADEDDAEAMHDAIEAERQTATVTVSWPDEQQPADPVSGEQQDGPGGGKGSVRAASLLAFLDLHRERRGHDVIASLAVGDGSTVELTQVQLRAVLAERDALATRVAELESERAADTQAVAAALVAYIGRYVPDAMLKLYARFADRIAAHPACHQRAQGRDSSR